MDEKTLKRQMSARWGLLIVDVVLLLVLGLIYAWSVFRGPLMADLGDGVKSTFTITMIMFCIGGLVGGIINSKTSPKVTMLPGIRCDRGLRYLDGHIRFWRLSDLRRMLWLRRRPGI